MSWTYQMRFTTWIPVAGTSGGFSTGDVLVDWTNRVSRRVGRVAPFGRMDLANTVPDTPVFILPYTARGTNLRLEGGTNVEITKVFTAGASYYDVLSFGSQSVYSRLVSTSDSGLSFGETGGTVGGSSESGFMSAPLTVGNDLTRDHGFSTWLSASPSNYVDLEVAYTRSYGYDLNTVSFGLGFNVGASLRQHRLHQ